MWPAAMGAIGGAAGGGSSMSSGGSETSSGGTFGGGTLGGINFGQYKSTDQNTILVVAAIVFIALVVMGKK